MRDFSGSMGERFDVLYERLLAVSESYHAASRHPDDVVSLAMLRWDLHAARRDIAAERRRLEGEGMIYRIEDRRWLDRLYIAS